MLEERKGRSCNGKAVTSSYSRELCVRIPSSKPIAIQKTKEFEEVVNILSSLLVKLIPASRNNKVKLYESLILQKIEDMYESLNSASYSFLSRSSIFF